MRALLKNRNGYMGAMIVVAIASIVSVMIIGITHKMGDLNKTYDKSRAFFDSEVAIEKFSVTLKNAYDKANYLTDILPPTTGGSTTIKDYGCPGKLVTIGNGPSAVRLCWEFGKNGLCTKRPLAIGTNLDICLGQSNLQVNLKSSNDWEVAILPPEKNPEQKWELVKLAAIEFIKDWAVPQAHANLDAFRPAIPVVRPTNSIAINMGLRSQPEAPDCSDVSFQCLKVSFCVKVGGACAPAELIRQTYLFSRPATTTQGW